MRKVFSIPFIRYLMIKKSLKYSCVPLCQILCHKIQLDIDLPTELASTSCDPTNGLNLELVQINNELTGNTLAARIVPSR